MANNGDKGKSDKDLDDAGLSALGSPDELDAELAKWDELFDGLHDGSTGSRELSQDEQNILGYKKDDASEPAAGDLLGGDDELEFLGEPTAFSSALGEPPPPIEADDGSLQGEGGGDESADAAGQGSGPLRPLDLAAAGKDTPAPSLAPAPTDDELFADLPERVDVDRIKPSVGSLASEATRVANVDEAMLAELAGDGGEVTGTGRAVDLGPEFENEFDEGPEPTRIADIDASLLAATATSEPGESGASPGGKAPHRRTIVRREDLDKRRAEAGDQAANDYGDDDSDFGSEFDSPEPTRIAAADVLQGVVDESALAGDEPAELELELDDDFYGSIEIGADAQDDAEGGADGNDRVGEPEQAVQVERRFAHTVRREMPETAPTPKAVLAAEEPPAGPTGDEEGPAAAQSGTQANDDMFALGPAGGGQPRPAQPAAPPDEAREAVAALDLSTLGDTAKQIDQTAAQRWEAAFEDAADEERDTAPVERVSREDLVDDTAVAQPEATPAVEAFDEDEFGDDLPTAAGAEVPADLLRNAGTADVAPAAAEGDAIAEAAADAGELELEVDESEVLGEFDAASGREIAAPIDAAAEEDAARDVAAEVDFEIGQADVVEQADASPAGDRDDDDDEVSRALDAAAESEFEVAEPAAPAPGTGADASAVDVSKADDSFDLGQTDLPGQLGELGATDAELLGVDPDTTRAPAVEAAVEAPPAFDPSALLEQPDVPPDLPDAAFDTALPRLDLAALDLTGLSGQEGAEQPGADVVREDARPLLDSYRAELELVNESANLAALHVESGRLTEQLGDVAAAAEHYQAAVAADPSSLPATRALRRLAQAEGRWEDAVRFLDSEVGLSSSVEQEALVAVRANVLGAMGELERAGEAVGDMRGGDQDDAHALVLDLELAANDGDRDRFSAVLERLSALVANSPLGAAATTARGRLAEGRDPTAAVDLYRAASDADPKDRGPLWGIERAALRAGELGDAATAAQRIIDSGLAELDADLAAALARRRALLSAGDPSAHADALEAAAALSENDPGLLGQLAAAYEARGDAAEAVRAFLRQASLAPSAADQAHAYRRAARLLAGPVGAPTDAVEALRRLNSVDPGDAEALAGLRKALAAAGDEQGLIDLERHAADADPEGGLFERVEVAKRLVAAGRMEDAELELARARERAPESSVVCDLLVRVRGLAGRTEQRAALLAELADSDRLDRDPEVAAVRAARAAEDFAFELLGADSALGAAGPAALEQAELRWGKVLERDPESALAHGAIVRLAGLRQERAALADALSEAQAAARTPARAIGYALRRVALALAAEPPDTAVAEELLQQARALDPAEPRTANALRVLLASNDRWAEAALVLEDRGATLGETAESLALRYRAGAMLHERTEEYARATELVRPVVEAVPRFAAGESLLESCHRKVGDPALVTESLERKLAASVDSEDPEHFAVLVREAELQEQRLGNPGRAATLFGRALEIRPDDPLALPGYLRTCEAAGEFSTLGQRALEALKEGQERGDDPAIASAYEELARIDGELRGDQDSAVMALGSAARHAPRRYAVQRALEKAFLRDDRPEELARTLYAQMKACEGFADVAGLGMALARALDRVDAQRSDVLRAYRSALAGNPRERLALFHLESDARARSAPELPELEQAIAGYFDTDPRARAAFMTRAGESLLDAADLQGAMDCFKLAAEALPGYLPALAGWRRAAIRGEQWAEVVEAAEAYADSSPRHSDRVRFHHLAGVTCMERELPPERAVAALSRVLVIEPGHDDAYLRLRALYEQGGDQAELAELLRHRLSVEDEPGRTRELRLDLAGVLRSALGRLDDANEIYREMLADRPGDPDALAGLSDIAWSQQRWRDAAEALVARAKIEQEPEELKQVFTRIGRIYSKHLPEPRWAVQSYQRVLRIDRDDQEALEQLSTLGGETGDWKMSLAACERLLQDPNKTDAEKIAILHRVADIYRRGFGDANRAERALRAALDVDPTNRGALDAMVAFFVEQGDTRSLRVHLDTVVQAMRKRLADEPLDGVAYHVAARALAEREQAGAKGSVWAARAAAEMAASLDAADDDDARLVAEAAKAEPSVVGLGALEIDEMLFHPGVPSGFRQLMRALAERLGKAVGFDLRAYHVGRSDRLGRGDAAADTIRSVAEQLDVGDVEIYVCGKYPAVLAAEVGRPARLVIGSKLIEEGRAGMLRFCAARALKLALSSMSVPARLTVEEFGALLAALLRAFRPDFAPPGVDAKAIEAEQQRLRKVVSGSQVQQLGPYAVEMLGGRFDHAGIWSGIVHTGNRAGLLATGSVQESIAALTTLGGHGSFALAIKDAKVLELLRFSVSEDHVALRSVLGRG